MKTRLQFLLFIFLSSFIFGQKTNTIDCKITYLPSIRNDDFLIKISKEQAEKIDSLANLKSFKIKFNEDDIFKFNELYNKKSVNGTRIYTISDSIYSKIINDKKIELNFKKLTAIGRKNIQDLLSGAIDGAPFILAAKTSNNKIILKNNFSGNLKLEELKEYLIFYFLYQDIKFCSPSSKTVEKYFSRENFFKILILSFIKIEPSFQIDHLNTNKNGK